MAVIYLEHPVHGQKVATSDAEARYDRANGWYEFDPNAPVVDEPPLVDLVNEMAPKRRSRRTAQTES